jgi:HAD superfamily hydrolase (TIGR01490 family)
VGPANSDGGKHSDGEWGASWGVLGYNTDVSEYVSMASSGPSAAFFDLDRTLISGSSAFVFATAARRAGLMGTRQLARDGMSALTFKLRGASDDKSAAVRDRILGAVSGMRQDDLVALNAEVLPRLLDKIRPEARRLLDLHRHAGRNTYIVSAAPVEIVESLAHSLGMTAGIGTRGEVVDGAYTGRLAGPFVYGAGKVTAMEEFARWDGLDLAQCYAYSDSSSDLPMLQAVGHPVAVNPDSRLARHARASGWPIVHFSQRTKSVIRRSATAAGATAIAGVSFAAGTKFGRRLA